MSRIYAPPFATLALVENVGGAYMRDVTFYLPNMPPLPVPCIDVDILILQTDTEAGWTRSYTGLSRPPETRIPFGQDRLREVGHSVDGDIFQALPGFVCSMCSSTRRTRLRLTANSLAVLCCRSTTETLQCRSFDEELPADHVAGISISTIWLGVTCHSPVLAHC